MVREDAAASRPESGADADDSLHSAQTINLPPVPASMVRADFNASAPTAASASRLAVRRSHSGLLVLAALVALPLLLLAIAHRARVQEPGVARGAADGLEPASVELEALPVADPRSGSGAAERPLALREQANTKGTIVIKVLAEGRLAPALVEVDGRRLGPAPRAFLNHPGRTHAVRVELPGFVPSRFEVVAGPTGTTVEVELRPAHPKR
jgi:hypothetical protein